MGYEKCDLGYGMKKKSGVRHKRKTGVMEYWRTGVLVMH